MANRRVEAIVFAVIATASGYFLFTEATTVDTTSKLILALAALGTGYYAVQLWFTPLSKVQDSNELSSSRYMLKFSISLWTVAAAIYILASIAVLFILSDDRFFALGNFHFLGFVVALALSYPIVKKYLR